MARRIGAPHCYQCGTAVRSMAEHLTTERHRARTSSVRSTGPKGSQPYHRRPVLPGSDADYDAMLEERWYAAQPPTIDELPALEPIEDGLPDPAPAVRGHRPPPCDKCGKSFRTDAGRHWHLQRNPRCEKWRVRAA